MLRSESLKKYIDEIISEVEKELDEATTTGDIAGYETPNAFSDGSDATKRRKKKIATQLGMQLVGKVESVNEAHTSFVSGNSGRTITHLDNKKYQLTKDIKGAQIGNYHSVVLPKGSIITNLPGGVFASHPSLKDRFSGIKETPNFGFRVTTNPDTLIAIEKSSKILESVNEIMITEKQFKGLEGIPANTSLEKITKDQKLKIIKGVGNIIDFIVPKGLSRNFWQVIGTGKIKKNLSGEYYLEGKIISSPMFKSIDDLIDGVKWKSMEERRRFNESVNEESEGLWANIRAKRARGEKPAPKNSKAYKDAVKAGKEINKNESVNEYNLNDIIKQVKTYDNPKDEKLLTIKVINKLKDSRNKSNPSKKIEIQKIIDTIEGDYKKGKYLKLESVNENRWLELKNDNSMHANKKLAIGLKELKYQLSEVETFLRWYNQIKTMNELDSNQYWKRTNSHIYKIKERIINIARTLQEIEK
jgi:hypothetical protein